MAITRPPVLTPWADTGLKTQPSSGQFSSGYATPARPGYRQFNWLFNHAMNGIRYLARRGIADWDSAETYAVGDLVRDTYSQGLPSALGGGSVSRSNIYRARGGMSVGVPPSAGMLGTPPTWDIVHESLAAILGDYTRNIQELRNARNMVRWGVDHMGFTFGPFLSWDENFDRWGYNIGGSGGAVPAGDVWTALNTGGSILALPPGAPDPLAGGHFWPLWPRMDFAPPTVSATGATLWRHGTCYPNTSDLGVSLRWKALMTANGTNRTRILQGLVDARSSAGTTPGYGAWFSKASTDTNWQCNVNGTVVNSGVAPPANAWQDFRIEIIGANVDDNSAGKVLFFIDESCVANVATVVSSLAGAFTDPLSACFTAVTTTTGGAAVHYSVAAAKYRQCTDAISRPPY
jgi:hypothetical protein